VSALVALGLAEPTLNFEIHRNGVEPWDFVTKPKSLTEVELCQQIGRISGCSGCEIGTKHRCVWVSYGASDQKRSVAETEDERFGQNFIQYDCVPRDHLAGLQFSNPSVVLQTAMCPADVKKEPIVRSRITDLKDPVGLRQNVTTDQDFAETSVIKSSWFDSDLAEFAMRPWPVDRTSFYGPIGASHSDPVAVELFDCAHIVGRDLVDVHKEAGGEESTILNGFLLHDRDKFCVRLTLAAYISSRCPQYGVAVSGVCWSYYDEIIRNCPSDSSGSINAGALDESQVGRPYSKATELYKVVPDSTPFCLMDFPTRASGHFESMAGLYIPNSELEAMLEDGKPFEYDLI